MYSTHAIKTELEKVFRPRQASVLAKVIVDAHSELVRTDDFNELKEIVRDIGVKTGELAEAQKRTEIKVEELAEAQKRTEIKVEELAEAQKRTEIKVEELAEAQKESQKEISRLDKTMKELAEAQKRTEIKVEELAEAQKLTEESLNRLIGKTDVMEERLEGLSNSVGYSLENIAYKALPRILKDEGIEVVDKLIRRYYKTKKDYNQINIFGKAKRGDREILILGEVKVRPSKREIDRFLKIAEWVKREEGNPESYLIFAAHDYHPNTERYLKEKGIRYFWSYEL